MGLKLFRRMEFNRLIQRAGDYFTIEISVKDTLIGRLRGFVASVRAGLAAPVSATVTA